jgi:RNA polymerase sigma-70 factor (ECF subfamily)
LRHSPTDKTQQLVALAKEGNDSAVNQLWKVYGARVHWIMRLRMGSQLRSKLESMDLAQEALLSAFGDLENFTYKNEGDFLRWLSTIAENRLRDNLDKLHADKRDIRKEVHPDNRRLTFADPFALTHDPVDATTPSMIMSRKEELEQLEKAIDKLKSEYKQVIILTRIEGLTYKEIAKRLGKSDEAVRKLVSRAMASLTSVFESDG